MYENDDFEEVYSGEGREDLVDNDGISASEEGFMKGYDTFQKSSDESKSSDQAYEKAFDSKRRSRRSKSKSEVFDEEVLEADTLMR